MRAGRDRVANTLGELTELYDARRREGHFVIVAGIQARRSLIIEDQPGQVAGCTVLVEHARAQQEIRAGIVADAVAATIELHDVGRAGRSVVERSARRVPGAADDP